MSRFAVLTLASDTVVNIIEAPADHEMVDGFRLVLDDDSQARLGDIWNGARFITPLRPPRVPSDLERDQETWQVATFEEKLALVGKYAGLIIEGVIDGGQPIEPR